MLAHYRPIRTSKGFQHVLEPLEFVIAGGGIEPSSKTISQKPLISPPNLDLASSGTSEHTPASDNLAILGIPLALQRHCAKIVLKKIQTGIIIVMDVINIKQSTH
jgi:hypothetical protein